MIDGPYIYTLPNGQLYTVQAKFEKGSWVFKREELPVKGATTFRCHIDHGYGEYFDFQFKNAPFEIPPTIYGRQEKLFVLSDFEGNFEGFQRILKGNSIIDDKFNWSYGKGHLVLVGDFTDRGNNVIPLLWLIYKLEFQAITAGGQVHLLLGNHEDFFITTNTKYVHQKYTDLAKAYAQTSDKKLALRLLLSEPFILRQWLLSKNTIESIGNILFVHGGISQQLLATKLTMSRINQLIRLGMPREPIAQKELLPTLELLFGSFGPLWYRGFVFGQKKYSKDTEETIQKILDYFKVDHIVSGHNIVDKISSDYNRKVFRIDIEQSYERQGGFVQGLLIKDGIFYVAGENGETTPI